MHSRDCTANVLLAYMPWQPSDVLARTVRAAVLIALSGVNIAGLDVVADFSAFLMVGILTVFLAEVPYAVRPHMFSFVDLLGTNSYDSRLGSAGDNGYCCRSP